jgi:hypothetical protein
MDMEKTKHTYNSLIGKPEEEKRPSANHGRSWDDIKMDVKYGRKWGGLMGYSGMLL